MRSVPELPEALTVVERRRVLPERLVRVRLRAAAHGTKAFEAAALIFSCPSLLAAATETETERWINKPFKMKAATLVHSSAHPIACLRKRRK
jgi:hypothetical protein